MSVAAAIPAPWLSTVARIGLAAKGIVYCLIGLVATMAAFQMRGGAGNTDKEGVFRLVLQQPAGKVLLAVITLGLLCYCVWRFLQCFFNTSHKDDDAKGYGKRASYLFSGLTYLFVTLLAGKMLLGNGGSGGNSRQELVQQLLSKPGGQYMVGIAALILAGIGVYQIIYGYSEKYKKHINRQELDADASRALLRAGKVGYIARGIVWLVIAFLFLKAALHANAREAGDTSSAFQFIQHGPYGTYLLSGLAFGLICYGVMNFIRAAYERL
jgi:hypothetical protein